MGAGRTTTPLHALADACGVMTSYLDYLDRPVQVSDDAVRRVLDAMGVAADTDADVSASLDAVREAAARALLPPSVVVRSDRDAQVAHRFGSKTVEAALLLADGSETPLAVTAGAVALGAGLPLGDATLVARSGSTQATVPVLVTPPRCPQPARPGWGWMVQLYQARSRDSWGIGDLGDLATLTRWSGQRGASFLLVNPLHAANPGEPQEPSPYYPSSRRFRNPLYLRIEALPAITALDAGERAAIDAEAARARAASSARIDRDAIARAKLSVLRRLHRVGMTQPRRAAYQRFRAEQGQALIDFATFCALAERHGTPWTAWPASLHDPSSDAVAAARRELADSVELHTWLQWLCDEQLAEVQRQASAAGLDVGIIHDLAVGVDPGGADAWALQADLSGGATVGAPPDGFNQRGQNWQLPPFLPSRLRRTAYAPFREMVRSVLRGAGGIRIDHVMGLWRLWWVPEGASAAEGAYVRYPADDLLGVLALEAHAAGAVAVGEDLGTVEKGVRAQMADRGVLSSRVVWFERIDDDPEGERLPAADYPQGAMTSITTHDLPTAAGWWADEDVLVQTELGLFGETTTPEAQATRKAGERAELGELLVDEGLLPEVPDGPVTDSDAARDVVRALHGFLARTPSLLIATGLGDALGDRSQPNMPGTSDTYPNWKLPLGRTAADGARHLVDLEDVLSDPEVERLVRLLGARRGAAGGA